MKLKKFLSLLMVAALCVGFTACGGDDDEDTVPSSVVGTWKFDRLDYDIKSSVPSMENLFKEAFDSGDYDVVSHTIVFKEDNTFTTTEGSDVDNGTYTYSNGVLTLAHEDGEIVKCNVIANGNTLRLSYSILAELGELTGMGISKLDLILIYQKQ